jgi:hypothetical protein
MRIRVVTFHTTDDRWAHKPHPLGGLKPPHSSLIPIFARSVRKSNPNARLELLTDETTVIPGAQFDALIRRRLDHEFLMLERLRAQTELLRTAEDGDLIAFLDTDTIVLQDLRKVFVESFDIGVTIRDNPQFDFERRMPYNNGVIFAKAGPNKAALRFFEHLQDRLEALPPAAWAWSGNQFVVRDVLGVHAPSTLIVTDHASVKVFPCSSHNYTPNSPGENLETKLLLHFRGDAKHLMEQYGYLAD